jgi:hypothetical protein
MGSSRHFSLFQILYNLDIPGYPELSPKAIHLVYNKKISNFVRAKLCARTLNSGFSALERTH